MPICRLCLTVLRGSAENDIGAFFSELREADRGGGEWGVLGREREGGREGHVKGMSVSPSKNFRPEKRNELPCMDCSLHMCIIVSHNVCIIMHVRPMWCKCAWRMCMTPTACSTFVSVVCGHSYTANQCTHPAVHNVSSEWFVFLWKQGEKLHSCSGPMKTFYVIMYAMYMYEGYFTQEPYGVSTCFTSSLEAHSELDRLAVGYKVWATLTFYVSHEVYQARVSLSLLPRVRAW